jgi:hypothetical protein
MPHHHTTSIIILHKQEEESTPSLAWEKPRKKEKTNKLVVESCCNGSPVGVRALSSSRTPDRYRVRVCTFPVMPEEENI